MKMELLRAQPVQKKQQVYDDGNYFSSFRLHIMQFNDHSKTHMYEKEMGLLNLTVLQNERISDMRDGATCARFTGKKNMKYCTD